MNKTMAGVTLTAIILASGAQAQDARQEGPIEIDKCQTISEPGSYQLVNNLTFNGPANGTCLSITANNVTIDLGGFMITSTSGNGPTFTFPTAIGANTTGITVRNGSISGSFGAGVSLGGPGSIVEGLNVSHLAHVGISASGIVRGNTLVLIAGIPGSGGTGIVATGLISGNYVSETRDAGIEAGQGSTVIGNVTGPAAFGIEVTCPSNVIDNTATGAGVNLVLNGTGCNTANNVAP